MDTPEIYSTNGDIRFRNNFDDLKPNPCPDCKKTYKVSNSVDVRVDNGRVAWEGCVDCWIKRTSPEMCQTFEKASPGYTIINHPECKFRAPRTLSPTAFEFLCETHDFYMIAATNKDPKRCASYETETS